MFAAKYTSMIEIIVGIIIALIVSVVCWFEGLFKSPSGRDEVVLHTTSDDKIEGGNPLDETDHILNSLGVKKEGIFGMFGTAFNLRKVAIEKLNANWKSYKLNLEQLQNNDDRCILLQKFIDFEEYNNYTINPRNKLQRSPNIEGNNENGINKFVDIMNIIFSDSSKNYILIDAIKMSVIYNIYNKNNFIKRDKSKHYLEKFPNLTEIYNYLHPSIQINDDGIICESFYYNHLIKTVDESYDSTYAIKTLPDNDFYSSVDIGGINNNMLDVYKETIYFKENLLKLKDYKLYLYNVDDIEAIKETNFSEGTPAPKIISVYLGSYPPQNPNKDEIFLKLKTGDFDGQNFSKSLYKKMLVLIKKLILLALSGKLALVIKDNGTLNNFHSNNTSRLDEYLTRLILNIFPKIIIYSSSLYAPNLMQHIHNGANIKVTGLPENIVKAIIEIKNQKPWTEEIGEGRIPLLANFSKKTEQQEKRKHEEKEKREQQEREKRKHEEKEKRERKEHEEKMNNTQKIDKLLETNIEDKSVLITGINGVGATEDEITQSKLTEYVNELFKKCVNVDELNNIYNLFLQINNFKDYLDIIYEEYKRKMGNSPSVVEELKHEKEQQVIEEPKPIVDEPKPIADEPKIEEPKPIVDEPKIEESKPIVDEPKSTIDMSKIDEQQKREEKKKFHGLYDKFFENIGDMINNETIDTVIETSEKVMDKLNEIIVTDDELDQDYIHTIISDTSHQCVWERYDLLIKKINELSLDNIPTAFAYLSEIVYECLRVCKFIDKHNPSMVSDMFEREISQKYKLYIEKLYKQVVIRDEDTVKQYEDNHEKTKDYHINVDSAKFRETGVDLNKSKILSKINNINDDDDLFKSSNNKLYFYEFAIDKLGDIDISSCKMSQIIELGKVLAELLQMPSVIEYSCDKHEESIKKLKKDKSDAEKIISDISKNKVSDLQEELKQVDKDTEETRHILVEVERKCREFIERINKINDLVNLDSLSIEFNDYYESLPPTGSNLNSLVDLFYASLDMRKKAIQKEKTQNAEETVKKLRDVDKLKEDIKKVIENTPAEYMDDVSDAINEEVMKMNDLNIDTSEISKNLHKKVMDELLTKARKSRTPVMENIPEMNNRYILQKLDLTPGVVGGDSKDILNVMKNFDKFSSGDVEYVIVKKTNIAAKFQYILVTTKAVVVLVKETKGNGGYYVMKIFKSDNIDEFIEKYKSDYDIVGEYMPQYKYAGSLIGTGFHYVISNKYKVIGRDEPNNISNYYNVALEMLRELNEREIFLRNFKKNNIGYYFDGPELKVVALDYDVTTFISYSAISGLTELQRQNVLFADPEMVYKDHKSCTINKTYRCLYRVALAEILSLCDTKLNEDFDSVKAHAKNRYRKSTMGDYERYINMLRNKKFLPDIADIKDIMYSLLETNANAPIIKNVPKMVNRALAGVVQPRHEVQGQQMNIYSDAVHKIFAKYVKKDAKLDVYTIGKGELKNYLLRSASEELKNLMHSIMLIIDHNKEIKKIAIRKEIDDAIKLGSATLPLSPSLSKAVSNAPYLLPTLVESPNVDDVLKRRRIEELLRAKITINPGAVIRVATKNLSKLGGSDTNIASQVKRLNEFLDRQGAERVSDPEDAHEFVERYIKYRDDNHNKKYKILFTAEELQRIA